MLVSLIASAQAFCPGFPDSFYGTVTIDGANASLGTVIEAKILDGDGEVKGTYTIHLTEGTPGVYGNPAENDFLFVSGCVLIIGWFTGGRSRFCSSDAGVLPVLTLLASQLCIIFNPINASFSFFDRAS